MGRWFVLLGLVALLGAAAAIVRIEKRVRPNLTAGSLRGYSVLLVTIDTLRADQLGCYGSKRHATPFLDRLASEGIRFETVYSHAPLTLPSHVSIFTGQYPSAHGVHDNGSFRVPPSQATLTSILQEAGYQTAAFVGAFVLDSRFGLDRGFELYDDDYSTGHRAESRISAFENVERPAEEVGAAAERWLKTSSGKLWFAWIHLYDPHAPYEAPPSFQARYPGDGYTAEVAYVDYVLEGLFDRLRSSGALRRTLVVVTADHGESLGEHGETKHGVFAYDSTLRVPWLLWGEGVPRKEFSSPVRQVDLMPSVLDLLGLAVPTAVAGESLRPYLNEELPYEPPPTYFEALNANLTRDWAPLRGLIRNRYKLIDLPIPELYDLRRDPAERENIYSQETKLRGELKRELDRMAAPHEMSESIGVDEESVARLRSLGYLVAPTTTHKGDYTEADDPKQLIGLFNQYEDAAENFLSGDREAAEAKLRELLEVDRHSLEARLALAYVLHEAGKTEEAIQVLEQSIDLGFQGVSLQRLLGVYLVQAGHLQRAAAILEKALAQDFTSIEARTYLGVAYSHLGRHAEARTQFASVLAVEPKAIDARVNLGTLELETGRPAEAIVQFKLALESDPQLPNALNGLGAAYFRMGDVEGALACWRRTIEIDPREFDALYNLASTLATRNSDEAVPFLEQFAATAPTDVYSPEIAEARRLLQRIQSRPARH